MAQIIFSHKPLLIKSYKKKVMLNQLEFTEAMNQTISGFITEVLFSISSS